MAVNLSNLNISLDQFQKMASGDYQAAWNTSKMDADHVASRNRTNFEVIGKACLFNSVNI